MARRDSAPEARAAALPAPDRVAELQARLLDWYGANGRDLPWRRTNDPYAVLVSEVMLQQTQVARVVPRFEAFLRLFPTLEALAGRPLADVLRSWRGLGYNNRAERLWRCARVSVARSSPGRPVSLPDTLEGLLTLPGIGPYTARAVMVFAHNADLAAVDANVRRVLTHELDLTPDLGPLALQAVADAVLPRGRSLDWHNALMDYGSLVLTARATGIAPRTRQGAFEGSRRWYRSRLLRALLDDGAQDVVSLAQRLQADALFVEELCRALEDDGLVCRRDGRVDVA
jgi:A/G-specific adenine glycosylase